MEWNLKTIGLITAIFFIGYIIGLVEAAIKQRRKAKDVDTNTVQANSQPKQAEQPSLLRINRRTSESLVVEIQGETFIKPEDIPLEKRKSLINLLIELRPWVENFETGSSPSPSHVSTKLDLEDNKIHSAKSNQEEPEILKPDGEKGTGMISEIDDILQERIAASPLSNKGIHLIEAPTGGVMVNIGMNTYEGIETVPDPEIKKLIQNAVREWEERN